MQIITNISHNHHELNITIAGDYLQTLFVEDEDGYIHSMNIFKSINPTYFDIIPRDIMIVYFICRLIATKNIYH